MGLMYPRCAWKCFVYEKKGKNVCRRQARKMVLPLGQPPFIFYYVYMFYFLRLSLFLKKKCWCCWKHNDCNNNNHTHKGKTFFLHVAKVIGIMVLCGNNRSCNSKSTIHYHNNNNCTKGNKVWGGATNGTMRRHYHHYMSMKLSKSPMFYKDLPCLRILGEVWNKCIKGCNLDCFFDFSFFWLCIKLKHKVWHQYELITFFILFFQHFLIFWF